jgi:hypothetical protein
MAFAKRKPLEKFRTPIGTAVYPRLNAPDTKYIPDGEYSAKIRLSEEDAAPLVARIEELIAAKFEEEKARLVEEKKMAAAKTLKLTSKPYKPVFDAEGEETGEVEFNVKMKAQYTTKDGTVVKMTPRLFDASTPPQPLAPSVQVWGGSQIKVAGEFNPFATAIGVGISLRLNAVQVIKLVSGSSKGDSADAFGFAGESDGYQSAVEKDNDADNSFVAADDESEF